MWLIEYSAMDTIRFVCTKICVPICADSDTYEDRGTGGSPVSLGCLRGAAT
jgi:hypothetical protein